jgi:TolB-like protein/Flp pilus assembly protein TadD
MPVLDPGSESDEPLSLLARLKRRKLFQWAIAYAGGAWLVLQLLSLLAQPFAWPDLVMRAAVVLLVVGFVAVLVLAWFHGEKGEQRAGGMEISMLAALLIVAATGVLLVSRGGGVAAAVPPAGATASRPDALGNRRSIAVLPFASLSADPENSYFASGIHDELLTQLSKLGDLRVISRTSVMQYAGTTKPVGQIASELGVGVVLEGSVQRAGTRVRVQAQLIDAATDEHLWAESYDRDLTDVFAIQRDIAQQIASALQARLTVAERATLAQAPTQNPEAYDFYLQARDYHLRADITEESLETARRLYERAVALDPTFALAHAWLSYAHGQVRWWGLDRSDARRDQQRAAAERAVQLQPRLPEARMALGLYHYWGHRDYERALIELRSALQSAPGHADLHYLIGAVLRRQGKFEEGVREMEQALLLDPRNTLISRDLALAYTVLRRFTEADRILSRVLELAPDYYDAAASKGELYITWRGTVDTLHAAAHRFTEEGSGTRSVSLHRFTAARLTRDHGAALRAAEAAPEMVRLQRSIHPRALLIGWARQGQGDAAGARSAFATAHATLSAALKNDPEDERLHVAQGFALAGLGRRAEAAAAIRRADALMPRERDAFLAVYYARDYAAIRAQAGDVPGAIAELQRLLSGPSLLSAHDLRLDPIWDPIRDDPRFQTLLRHPVTPR